MHVKNVQNLARCSSRVFLSVLFLFCISSSFSQQINFGITTSFYHRLHNYFPTLSISLDKKEYSLDYHYGRGINNFLQWNNGTSLHNIQILPKFLVHPKYTLHSGFSLNYAHQFVEYRHHYFIPEVLFKNTFGEKLKINLILSYGLYIEKSKSFTSSQTLFHDSFRIGCALSYAL